MHIDSTSKVANSLEALHKILDAIASGRQKKPDWIRLQGACRLDRVDPPQRKELLARLHASVLRGFKANNCQNDDAEARIEYWRSVSGMGFHDFSDQGWMKCYDSPFVENYDYISSYLEDGLDSLDAYAAYSSVLGTFDFTAEDFVNTELCQGVGTIIEPMAGTAEFAYHSHFRNSDFRYVMVDLDESAQSRVLAQNWLPDTEKHYLHANVLDESVWAQIKSVTTGESLSYIGKQSHHLFSAKELFRLMDVATQHVDYFMLETPQLAPVMEMGGTDDLTRPEMKDAGFEVELIEDPDGEPNPFTNLMHFHLGASDPTGHRKLFEYRNWTVWSQSILVTLARILDLNAFYFHSELHEFVSVEEEWQDCDVEDEVTFMLFTRRELPPSP
jgi:hypothetical protein